MTSPARYVGHGQTLAPLVADSLLNFMSGSVRTNTLRITAETASQPILLLTVSDLEAQSEVDLVARHAGATYTLTGQWQHIGHGGDVVNQTDARQVSLICPCGPSCIPSFFLYMTPKIPL